jgi:hypothetical protein
MTREEKIKLAISKGYTYDENTGKIYGVKGLEITRKKDGYITTNIKYKNKSYELKLHQLAYYIKYNKIVEQIDHIDGNRSNNKIDNLREVTHQQNAFNRTTTKGYYPGKNNFKAHICINNKQIYLGTYNTEEEARKAYLDAKNIYHII